MIRVRNLDPKDGAILPYSHFSVIAPAADTDYFVASVDLNAAAVGNQLTLVREWAPTPMTVFMTVVDNSGTSLSCTILVVGEDQFGQPVRESITATGSATTTHGTKVFRRITKVTISALANKAASDTLVLGITANATSIKFGLPYRPRKVSASGVGGARDTVKVALDAGAVDTNFTVDATNSAITSVAIAAAAELKVVADLSPLIN